MRTFAGNLYKDDLEGDNIGVFFGTLAPMHVGHQAEIYKAAALNDGVVVIASGYTGDRGDQMGLPVEKRFRYLREAFSDESDIKIDYINEDNMPQMPDGWDEWTRTLVATVKRNIVNQDAKITFYTGEPDYKVELEKRLPQTGQFKVSLMDRTVLKISATEIRKDPIANWDYINRVFRRHFTKKVTVMGSASTGKSTLVRRLARTSNSPFSEEYAREYQERSNVSDDELIVKDYIRLIQGQYDANSREINSPANNGLTIFDTDAMVTKVYADMWLDEADRAQLQPLFDNTISEEQIDLILVIPPVTPYVDDGFRNMSTADEASRWAFHHALMRVIDEYGFMDKVVLLDAKGDSDDPYGYYARYLQALDAIQERTGFNIKHLE
ncbi:MAG: nicotinamide-nucleotide adenylyltransferase [Leuconostoc lactis]|uniref:nicotinamide-nucleotide adenylyltransferase n=1 Tax=Leuconostoc lactis TaxID=1246 RepID=UPI0002FFB9C3|nr:nicotinamide-nucleotide adenylyltransferase [Leuconostoc lactis]ANY11182.1 nicotinamide-nucleotide adenylyltransferase [Leuconostoc lactis]MBA5813723.1 nicotinamide-nucleotide adenylyltransferase [Leuconostoc lactis]MDI6495255.1 nicotinamide-nucleotide adenylyltransferase [Leuconostoc lactis]MDI6573284.1 nicotinamide-nucleotide adenylyltransferase [Leuconostoc lactis]MDN2649409.1 nicotinamide-nucleotide adenylyltransferase [Leuconostoc lactis]